MQARGEGKDEAPMCKYNVMIGIGAALFGEVKSENDVFIESNAVVLKDIYDNLAAASVSLEEKNLEYRGEMANELFSSRRSRFYRVPSH